MSFIKHVKPEVSVQHVCTLPTHNDMKKNGLVAGTVWKCESCDQEYVYIGYSRKKSGYYEHKNYSAWVKPKDWNFKRNRHEWISKKYYG